MNFCARLSLAEQLKKAREEFFLGANPDPKQTPKATTSARSSMDKAMVEMVTA